MVKNSEVTMMKFIILILLHSGSVAVKCTASQSPLDGSKNPDVFPPNRRNIRN